MLTSVTYLLEEPAHLTKIFYKFVKNLPKIASVVMVKYFLLLLLVFHALTFPQKFAFYPLMSTFGEVDTHFYKF